MKYLEGNCEGNWDTLVSSDDVPTLALDNRGIFVCGAAVSVSLDVSTLLAAVNGGCDTGGREAVYSTCVIALHFTQL